MFLDFKNATRTGLICLFGSLTASLPGSALASSGALTLLVSATETFLENDSQALNDSGHITKLSPGLNYLREGRNSAIDINYRLNAISYHGLSEPNRETHDLDLSTKFTHKPGQWSSQIRGGITQANLDPNGLQVVDPLLTSTNTEELRTLNMSTLFQGKIAKVGTYNFNLGANIADFKQAQSTEGLNAGFSIASFRTGVGLDWAASLKTQQSTSGSRERNIDDAALNFGYPFNEHWRLFTDLTRTKTDVPKDESDSAILGVDYRAGRMTGIRFGAGQRDSNDTYFLNVDHRTRHISLSTRYSEEIIAPRSQSLKTLNQQEAVQTSFQDLSIAPVLQQRADLGVVIEGKKSSVSFRMFDSRQKDRANVVPTQVSRGIDVGFSRTLSLQSELSLTLLEQETEQTRSNRLTDLSIGYARTLAKSLDFNTGMRFARQKSDASSLRYEQRSIFASIKKQF
jgi:hypothetical protein